MISFLKRYVFHNFVLKIISLALATGLWIMISRDEGPAEVAIRSPILFENMPSQLEISTEAIPSAQIRVRGSDRVIRHLQEGDVHAEIDLSGVKVGTRTFNLTSQQVRHPRDVDVMQVVPSRLTLSFDTRLTRQVEIHPRVTGGENILKADPDPATVTITGPQSHVERIDEAITDPIDATGVRGTATFTTNVYVSDSLVQVVDPTSIRVTVTVGKNAAAPAH
jgi:YbbR domain-containing protein